VKLCALGSGQVVALTDEGIRVKIATSPYGATLGLPPNVTAGDIVALGCAPVSLCTAGGDFWYHSSVWRCAGNVNDAPPPPPLKRPRREIEVEGRNERERGQPRETCVLLRCVGLGLAGVGEPDDIVHGARDLIREMVGAGSARRATPADTKALAGTPA